MAQSSINIRMDQEVKKQFEVFCSDVGMSMSTAVNIFAKTVIREHRIPFEIATKEDPFFSEANMARLRQSMIQMEVTGGTIHELIEGQDD